MTVSFYFQWKHLVPYKEAAKLRITLFLQRKPFMKKPHFLLNWCKQVSLSLLVAIIFLSDYCAQKHPGPGIWIPVSGSACRWKTLFFRAALCLATQAHQWARQWILQPVELSVSCFCRHRFFSVASVFLKLSQLFPNTFNPVIFPSSCFSFSWDLRGQASHNSRLSKYAQWKLWASGVAATAALSHESVPAIPCQGCCTSSWVPFPPLSLYLVLGVQYSVIS